MNTHRKPSFYRNIGLVEPDIIGKKKTLNTRFKKTRVECTKTATHHRYGQVYC